MLTNTSSQTKSPEIDFSASLFRNLSSILDPFSALETKQSVATYLTTTTATLDLNNSEKTYDLSDYLIQQQQQLQQQELKMATTLTELEPVRLAPSEERNKIVVLTNEEYSNDSSSSSSYFSGSTDNSGSKRKHVNDEPKKQTKPANKRGRKPASRVSVTQGASRSKFGKHELVTENNDKKTVVFFGNKKVEVGTAEYEKRRKNNNDAVRKCRQKMEQEQREREDRMKQLTDENRKLNDKVITLTKEMDVLKGIIISMRHDNKLPEYIQNSLNNL